MINQCTTLKLKKQQFYRLFTQINSYLAKFNSASSIYKSQQRSHWPPIAATQPETTMDYSKYIRTCGQSITFCDSSITACTSIISCMANNVQTQVGRMWLNVKSTPFKRSLSNLIAAMIYRGRVTWPLCVSSATQNCWYNLFAINRIAFVKYQLFLFTLVTDGYNLTITILKKTLLQGFTTGN